MVKIVLKKMGSFLHASKNCSWIRREAKNRKLDTRLLKQELQMRCKQPISIDHEQDAVPERGQDLKS